ncbi:hypothetical protein D3C80_1498760 [compost metagenome]
MIFIKPLHHFLAVIVETLAKHTDVGIFIGHRQLRFSPGIDIWPGEKLQRRRPCHLTRQNKTTRLDEMQTLFFALMEIVGPGLRNRSQPILICGSQRVQTGAQFLPF